MNTRYNIFPIICLLFFACSDVNENVPSEKIINEPGLYPISINHKYGYIDKTGKIVIEPQFDFALSYFEDLAVVLSGDKFGFI
ncbi:MAG TPA: WG repeat-containing protein, partial [Thermodesulfobacteriota bacterium]|nr:WG repeat-containing protein [Thermodesulfobacteriota bacterium]